METLRISEEFASSKKEKHGTSRTFPKGEIISQEWTDSETDCGGIGFQNAVYLEQSFDEGIATIGKTCTDIQGVKERWFLCKSGDGVG